MKEFRSGRNTASPSVSTQNTSGEINVSSDNGNSNANGPGAGSKRSSPVPAETGELRRSKRARAAVYNELVLARKVYSDAVEENDSVTKADTSLPAGASKDDSDSNEEIDTPSQRRRRLSSKKSINPIELVNDGNEADVSDGAEPKSIKRRRAKKRNEGNKDNFENEDLEEVHDGKAKKNMDKKNRINNLGNDSDKNGALDENGKVSLDASFTEYPDGIKPRKAANKFLTLMKKAAIHNSDDDDSESDDDTVNGKNIKPLKNNDKANSQSKAQPPQQVSQKQNAVSHKSTSKSLVKDVPTPESSSVSKQTSQPASKLPSKTTSKSTSKAQRSPTVTKTKPVVDISNGNTPNVNEITPNPPKTRRKSKSLPNRNTIGTLIDKPEQKPHGTGRTKRRSMSKIERPVSPVIPTSEDESDETAANVIENESPEAKTQHGAIHSDSDEPENELSKSTRRQQRNHKRVSYIKDGVSGLPGHAVEPATIKIESSPELGALQQVQNDIQAATANPAADSAYRTDRMISAAILNRHVTALRKLTSVQIPQGHDPSSGSSSTTNKPMKHCPTVLTLHPSLGTKLVGVGNVRGTVMFLGPGEDGSAIVGSKLRLHGKVPVSNIIVHPDNPAQVVTAGWDGSICTFDLTAPKASSGSIVTVDSHSLRDKLITRIAFANSVSSGTGAHGLHYATLSGIYGHVDLRAPVSTNRPMKLQSHASRAPLLDLAVRPDHPDHVATATADGMVKLWDTRYFQQDTYFATFSVNTGSGSEDGVAEGATLLTALDWSQSGLLAGVVDSEAGEQGALVFDRTLKHAVANPDATGGVRRLRYDAAFFSPIVNTAFAPPTYLLGSGALARDDGAARIVAAYGAALLSPVARFQARPLDGIGKFALLGNSGGGSRQQNNIVLLDNRANVLQTLELEAREPADDIALVEIHPLLNWTACVTRNNKLHIWG